MNKFLRFSMLSLALMLVGMVSAKEVTFLPTDFAAAENSDYSLTKDGVTMTVTSSTVTNQQFRIFKGQSVTFTATGSNLTAIVITCTANGAAKYGPGNFAATEGYTFQEDGNQGFWAGNSSTLTLTAEAAQVRATEIVVTVGEGSTVDPNPEAGTADNPYTVAQAQALLATLSANVKSDQVYAKGIISKIDQVDPSYGNATFYISDNGTEEGQLEVYRAVFLEKAKFTAVDQIKVGDEVVICGQLVNYRNAKAADTDPVTPEFTQGCYVYSLNGKTKDEGTDTPEPQPSSEVKAVTIADFNAAAESTDVWYQLTGTVKNLKDGDQYGNFDLEDETGSVYVYGVLSEKGGAKKLFQELVAAKGIKNGSKLTIIGNRGSYKDKIEVLNAYFVSVEGGTDTPEPQPSGEATGTGTLSDPFNALAAINFVAALEADKATEQDYYVKGKIVEITEKNQFSPQYGNCTFYISDDGTNNNAFYVFRTLYLGNVKYTEGVLPKAGDEVIICGKLVNYKGNTPETSANNSYIYSLNGNTGESSAVKSVTLETVADGYIYNLRGQRVENPTKGIYIRNGKKFVVK